MKKIIAIVGTIFLMLCNVSADFSAMNWGSRGMALGNAYSALADDPSTIFWNPAGLSKNRHFSLMLSHQNLYGISDLFNEMGAVSYPLKKVHLGFGWTQMNLWDEYAENIFYLSTSSVVWYKKIPIRFGTNFKYYQARVANFAVENEPDAFDFDLGIHTNITNKLALAAVYRNIFSPEFEFINTAEEIEAEYVFGVHYNWKNLANFTTDWVTSNDKNEWCFGSELWFYNVFATRIGLKGEKLTAGFGIKAKKWSIDGAVLAHNELGSTYRLSLSLNLGKIIGKIR